MCVCWIYKAGGYLWTLDLLDSPLLSNGLLHWIYWIRRKTGWDAQLDLLDLLDLGRRFIGFIGLWGMCY